MDWTVDGENGGWRDGLKGGWRLERVGDGGMLEGGWREWGMKGFWTMSEEH